MLEGPLDFCFWHCEPPIYIFNEDLDIENEYWLMEEIRSSPEVGTLCFTGCIIHPRWFSGRISEPSTDMNFPELDSIWLSLGSRSWHPPKHLRPHLLVTNLRPMHSNQLSTSSIVSMMSMVRFPGLMQTPFGIGPKMFERKHFFPTNLGENDSQFDMRKFLQKNG